jgi:tetratricopeptide (TPR) repeat protein
VVSIVRQSLAYTAFVVLACFLCCAPGRGESLQVSPEVREILDKIYSGDTNAAIESALRLQQEQSEHPLGYALEAEALWWEIWCTSAEFKWGMSYPRHRAKLVADRHYFELAAKVYTLADAQLKQHETAEMHFYAGTGDALGARLYALRGEGRNTARYGVRARDNFLRAIALDPELADAYFGLGLYNYYVDTLSAAARFLRFFMGIPGGNKQEGIRQLRRAMNEAPLVSAEARFYLAINLHNFDREYETALEAVTPLAEQYSSNPLFQLARGDLQAKLGRKEQAAESYRAALSAPMREEQCSEHVGSLARAALAAIGIAPSEANH